MDERQIREIVISLLEKEQAGAPPVNGEEIPVEVSARHVHLSAADVERLFGAGHTLTPERELSQPGEFLCRERVSLVTGKAELCNVAVLGPTREKTQVELSATDARALGLNPPLRLSGDLSGAADVLILNGNGYIHAKGSVIVAQSHIHMTPRDAARFGVPDGACVRVGVSGPRPVTFERVVVRVSERFALRMHIDFDEANACMLACGTVGHILPGDCAPPREAAMPVQTQAEGKSVYSSTERVVTEEVAVRLCSLGESSLRFTKGTVITPLARDAFTVRRVRYEIDSGKGRTQT